MERSKTTRRCGKASGKSFGKKKSFGMGRSAPQSVGIVQEGTRGGKGGRHKGEDHKKRVARKGPGGGKGVPEEIVPGEDMKGTQRDANAEGEPR